MVLMTKQVTCVDVERKDDKTEVYTLQVEHGEKPPFKITRTFLTFFDFTSNVKKVVQENKLKSVSVPSLPGLKWFQKFGNTTEKLKNRVNDFCKVAIALGEHPSANLLEGEVDKFFNAWMLDVQLDNGEVEKPEKTKDKGKDKKDKSKDKDKNKDKEKDKGKDKKDKKKKDKKAEKDEGPIRNSPSVQIQDELKLVLQPQTSTESGPSSQSEPDPRDVYVVVSDFLEPEAGQIALKAAQIVEVMQRTLTGWWFVTTEDGQDEGYAPASILEPLDPYLPDVITPDPTHVPGGNQKVTATTDYVSKQEDELSYKKGDGMTVITMSQDGWWTVSCGSSTGLVSATNLKLDSSSGPQEDLYGTCSLYQQHSVYAKAPPPRRDPSICLTELYAQVNKMAQLRPKPQTDKETPDPEGDDLYSCVPSLPARSEGLCYSEVVFDDQDQAGKSKVFPVPTAQDETLYSEIVLDKSNTPVFVPQTTANSSEQAPHSTGPKQRRSGAVPVLPGDHPSKATAPAAKVSPPMLTNRITKAQVPPTSAKPISTQHDARSAPSTPVTAQPGIGPAPSNSTNENEPSGDAPHGLCERHKSMGYRPQVPPKKRNELDGIVLCELCQQENAPERTGKRWVKKEDLKRVKCELVRLDKSPVVRVAPSHQQHQQQQRQQQKPNGPATPSKPAPPPPISPNKPVDTAPPPTSPKPAPPSEESSHTKHIWYAGSMGRSECEVKLQLAQDGQFFIRESKNEYSLSVKDESRVRHFQIRHPEPGEYVIGGFTFNSLKQIIKHYKKSPLYFSDSDSTDGRCLGDPFVVFK